MHNECFKSSLKWGSGRSSCISIDCSWLTPHLAEMCQHTCRRCKEFFFFFKFWLPVWPLIFCLHCSSLEHTHLLFRTWQCHIYSWEDAEEFHTYLISSRYSFGKSPSTFATFPHPDSSMFWPIIRDTTITQNFFKILFCYCRWNKLKVLGILTLCDEFMS